MAIQESILESAIVESASNAPSRLCNMHIKEIISIIANMQSLHDRKVICLFDMSIARKCLKQTFDSIPYNNDMSALIVVVPVKDYVELIGLLGQEPKKFVHPLKLMSTNEFPVIAVTEKGTGLFSYPIDIAKDIFKREFHHFVLKDSN